MNTLNYVLDRILPKIMRFIIISTQITFTLIIFGSVVARLFFGRDLYGNEDFILIAAFWLYMIGGAYGSFENSHIKADILTESLKDGPLKKFLLTCSSVLETIVNLVITLCGWQLVVWGLAKGAKSVSWKIPMVVPQSAIFVGFALMLIYSIRQTYRYLTGRPITQNPDSTATACLREND
ncbi:MAG: TRAP transporter small permease [Candidatus Adiutrix sp.]|jgi:TRAP-type C4-dicarboxylate transport system permease small subunit|nr:TRAP transporter small permease [Candidatus Adiutrix sp.]